MFEIWKCGDLPKDSGGAEMKDLDLNLPVIKNYDPPPNLILYMDEYIEFCQFNWDNTVDREAYRKWKNVIAVDVPFRFE